MTIFLYTPYMSPRVWSYGQVDFFIRTRESAHEPPHIHVKSPQFEVRVNLITGAFMEPPPKGKAKWLHAIVKEHLEEFRQAWDRYHPQRGGSWS